MPALTCPGCRQEMTESTSSGVFVDLCPQCSGLWLDGGEFEKLGGELPKGGVCYGGDRRCPRCDAPMEVRPSKVAELDLCPRCHGMYLDRSELSLLVRVAALASEDLSRVQPPQPRKKASAAPVPERFSKISSKPTEPRFVCAECRQPFPLSEQVIGAQQTVCSRCAGLKQVDSDPAARRKAELAKARPTRPPARSPAQAAPPSPAPEEDDIVADMLFGRRRPANASFDASASGLLDLIHHLLK